MKGNQSILILGFSWVWPIFLACLSGRFSPLGFRPKGALDHSQGRKPLGNDSQKESTPTGWHN